MPRKAFAKVRPAVMKGERNIHMQERQGDQRRRAELSIQKKYRKPIWNKFVGGLRDYGMLRDGDCVAVCISGGKDSMLLAKCMQLLQRFSPTRFELVNLVMDPGYSPENRARIEENAALLGLPVTIVENRLFEAAASAEKSPCYLCARMRRGCLYKHARALGCNKIALGHHFDDVIETVLMSMLYGAEMKTMMPKIHSTNFPGMELIRPLYLVREADIIAWARYNDLEFLRCACRLTEGTANGTMDSKRQEMKELIRALEQTNPSAGQNIFHSFHNVNLGTLVGYRGDGGVHPFLEEYDRPGSPYWLTARTCDQHDPDLRSARPGPAVSTARAEAERE